MTQDPVSRDYVPAYPDDPEKETARLVRCLQQQVEDCFTTLTRIEETEPHDKNRWKTVRAGLRCWRIALR